MTPFKKTGAPLMPYLDKDEVDALLGTPDQDSQQGRRDYALLLLLYNTGARVGEAAHLAVSDVTLGRSPSVRLLGKGSKTRCCPLWKHTADTIKRLVGSRAEHERVFLNRLGQPLTRFGIYGIVQRVARVTKDQRSSLRSKRISPSSRIRGVGGS